MSGRVSFLLLRQIEDYLRFVGTIDNVLSSSMRLDAVRYESDLGRKGGTGGGDGLDARSMVASSSNSPRGKGGKNASDIYVGRYHSLTEMRSDSGRKKIITTHVWVTQCQDIRCCSA